MPEDSPVRVERKTLADYTTDPYNTRAHNERNIAAIADSIQQVGNGRSLVADEDGVLICGNGTFEALGETGATEVLEIEVPRDMPVVLKRPGMTEAEKILMGLYDNRTTDTSAFDNERLREAVLKVDDLGLDISPNIFTDLELQPIRMADWDQVEHGGEEAGGGASPTSLADRFIVPPFSVLDARQGYWQERKRSWVALGIQSEIGRGENLEPDGPGLMMKGQKSLNSIRENGRKGKRLTWVAGDREDLDDTSERILAAQPQSGTSIFDPVLCELAVRWFCPVGGSVLDPFAGGSVRGVVAGMLGRSYHGIDLSPVQVAADIKQGTDIFVGGPEGAIRPTWTVGDSTDPKAYPDREFDFVFTCPPYFDLERYSDDPNDLSNMSWSGFLSGLWDAIAISVGHLRNDRFACVVVGDVRARDGTYRNLVWETVAGFRNAGMELWNEAVLVTMVGSLSIRAGRQFSATRKMGKAHQNVLVFVKGDARRAVEACGEVDTSGWEVEDK